MAEERTEGATTEGPSVTSTVDANERLPRLGDAASDRFVGGGAGAASNLPPAWVTQGLRRLLMSQELFLPCDPSLGSTFADTAMWLSPKNVIACTEPKLQKVALNYLNRSDCFAT